MAQSNVVVWNELTENIHIQEHIYNVKQNEHLNTGKI